MTDDRLKTGFETPDGLREFNAKWSLAKMTTDFEINSLHRGL